jgi:hypothetical protein
MKCRDVPVLFPDAPDIVYVLNTKAVPQEALARVNPDSIESVAIACASELHELFGIETRRGAVVIFTIPGPLSALKAAMAHVESLQKRYYAEHGEFAGSVEQLGWSDPSGLIRVNLSVTVSGTRWTATGLHRHRPWSSGVTVAGTKP